MRLRIGDAVLDTAARLLSRDGREVRLRPKVYELLELLVEHRPRAVSTERLRKHLWPDTHVVDGNLHVLVGQVRKVLGDDPQEPHWVRTVAGFGYAFSGDARVEAESPDTPWECRVIVGRRETVLRQGNNTIGRAPDASVWIDDDSVSRRHAIITVGPDGVQIQDCGSRNGTFRQRQRITGVVPLRDRSEVVVGGVLLTIRVTRRDRDGGSASPSTAPLGTREHVQASPEPEAPPEQES
jgi:DNA-binding winged helix-turn-helix (wHTH) protein